MHAHDQQTSLAPVIILASAAFVFNTTEFIPVALLSDIGTSFGMSSSQTGMIMTIYAWIVAILSLPMMLITAKIERKTLLLAVFALFAISHLVSYLASSFQMLIISRAMVAVTHAVFWSITASLVVRLAPNGMQTKALGLLSTGGALAMVLGLPLGRMLGQWLGWRASFGVIGITSLIIALLLLYYLPKLPAKNTGDLSSLPLIFKNKPILLIYLLILLTVTANFTFYSYIEPFVLTVANLGGQIATITLLIFGLAGVIGSVLFGRYFDKTPVVFTKTAMFGMLAMLIALNHLTSLFLVIVAIYGLCYMATNQALQKLLLNQAREHTDIAMAVFSTFFNVAIGLGAIVGGWTVEYIGLAYIGYMAAGVMVIVVACHLFSRQLFIDQEKLNLR